MIKLRQTIDIPFEIEDETIIDYDHLDEDEYVKDLRYVYNDIQIKKILTILSRFDILWMSFSVWN